MTVFRYKAVTESNEIVEGEIEASGRAALVEQLRGLGQFPLNAHELKSAATSPRFATGLFGLRRVSSREVLLITHGLATLLKAGVALDRAFEILVELCENSATQRLLKKVLQRLRSGASLAGALSEHQGIFPPYYASMVKAGEASGALDLVLSRLAEFMEKTQKVRESVKTAMYYPIFLLLIATVSIVVLLIFVIPQFEPFFENAGAALPVSTQIMIWLGDTVRHYGWLLLIGFAASIFFVRSYLSTAVGRRQWDALVIRLPLLGTLLTKVEIARFSRTTGTLLQSGVGLLNTLYIVRDALTNSVIASSIDSVAARVKEGRGLAEPLAAAGLFPRLAVHLVRVGEETGQLENMFSKIADIYDEEVERTTARLLAMLVPALTIFMGVVVATIIGSILTAILSVNSLAF